MTSDALAVCLNGGLELEERLFPWPPLLLLPPLLLPPPAVFSMSVSMIL